MEPGTLQEQAQQARAFIERGRAELVACLREADRSGMSQRQIAQLTGCAQSEVNRLVRFHGTSPNGKALRRAAARVHETLSRADLDNPRVFGSTARGEDGPGSDIDLLVASQRPIGLLSQARLERELSAQIGVPVDLVLEDSLRPDLREQILAEAVRL